MDIERAQAGLDTFARICVEVNLSNIIPDKIILKWKYSMWIVQLDYETQLFDVAPINKQVICKTPAHSCGLQKQRKKAPNQETKGGMLQQIPNPMSWIKRRKNQIRDQIQKKKSI